jgi:hypothetical protein
MSEADEGTVETADAQGGNESSSGDTPAAGDAKTFTQEEVNKLIGTTRSEERRKVSERYSDYDDLKKAADGKKTADQLVADLQKRIEQSETKALRAQVAADFRISTKRGDDGEPSDADLFLTGTDEETLTAQAKRFSDRMAEQAKSEAKSEADRKKKNPIVSKEGTSTKTGTTTEEDDREFARSFFGRGS